MSKFQVYSALGGAGFALAIGFGAATSVQADTNFAAAFSAERQAIAEMASEHEMLAEFYRARDFAPVWTGEGEAYTARRFALLEALEGAGNHGLPTGEYDANELRAAFGNAASAYQRGQAEALASRMFLDYAEDINSGILEPSELAADIHKELPRRDHAEVMAALLATDSPRSFMRSLPPTHPDYGRLQREMLSLEETIRTGGWGERVSASRLDPGDAGPAVIALRNRMIAMGFLTRSAAATYDGALQEAVQRFQSAHGLTPDGVAGEATITQINIAPEERLEQIILAMERQRWMNIDRGDRHILVNIPDFNAWVVDHEVPTFETRVVVGHRDSDRHTPEFSDVMEHMVINPSWNVPRSITVGEYLPQMQANPAAVGHLQLLRGGRVVSRDGIDFSQYTTRNFPFDLRQPPSTRNALGLVKFMFPNQWNIYLHDTPARDLFAREVRAYSHGCVRVHRPAELAYHLLAPQQDDPEDYYQRILRSGNETTVPLETTVPVHLVYWTAFITPDGRANYRRDVYGRNALLWRAMEDAGVSVRAVSS